MGFTYNLLPETGKWGFLCKVLNSFHERLRSCEIKSSLDILVNASAIGTTLTGNAKTTTTAGLVVERFRLVSAETGNGDYIYCHTWDGTNEGTDLIKIARPWRLLRTPWHDQTIDGQTYYYVAFNRRHVRASGVQENQVVVPKFRIGDEIFAVKDVTRGSGVTDEGGSPVAYIDLNRDGRAWAQVFNSDPTDGADPHNIA